MGFALHTIVASLAALGIIFFWPISKDWSVATQWLTLAASIFVFAIVWEDCFAPIKKRHEAREFGAGETQRIAGPTPPPYPNGWFCVLYSWELKKGEIKAISFLGRQLVAFRGKDSGRVSVLDAYCPHLGAHLAISSRIKGDSIECAFHGWKFSGEDGKCTDIPGQTCIPPQAHSRAWTVMERNQMILVWYHSDNMTPTWHPHVMEDVDEKSISKMDRAWIRAGRNLLYRMFKRWYSTMRLDAKEDFIVNAHIQEIPENTADVAHLNVLHHLPWDIPIIEEHFRMDWQGWWRVGNALEDGGEHTARVPVKQQLFLFGKGLPFFKMTTDIHLIGPGLVLYLFHTPIGTMRLFETVTPGNSPLHQQISLVLFSSRFTPRWLAKWFFRGVAKTLSQDCFIWNNKTYNNKPPLAKGDRYLPTFRKWYSQFYTPSSVSMQEASRSISLDW